MPPKLSVIVPTYRGADYIGDTMSAVLSQTFEDFEVVVIHQESGDETMRILESLGDERIKIHRMSPPGYPSCMNCGLEHCTGDYIAVQDDDDVPVPHRFERQVRYLDEHPGMIAVSGMISFIDGKGNVLPGVDGIKENRRMSAFEHLYAVNVHCAHTTMMFRRGPVDEGLRYDERFYVGPDILFELNLFYGRAAHHIEEPLVAVRRNIHSVMAEGSIGRRFSDIRKFKRELYRERRLPRTMYMRAMSSDHFHQCGEYWSVGMRGKASKHLLMSFVWNPLNWRIWRGITRMRRRTVPLASMEGSVG
jgi:glycosyltransferase involved in cell wall biosynthesis